MTDAKAVLDAAESSRANVLGHGDGGLVAMLLAASYPERISGVIIQDGYALLTSDDDYEGWDPDVLASFVESIADLWGSGHEGWVYSIAPSQSENEVFRERLARMERLSVSPGAAAALQRVIVHLDVRPVLPTISAPTLVLLHRDNLYIQALFGRYLAEQIPDAKLVELDGGDHLYWVGDPDAALDEIEQFVTGTRPQMRVDRVLATVLFTDIVGSTETLIAMGDERWSELLSMHHEIVRRELDLFDGQEVDTAGDGFFALFDGPARAIRCALGIRDKLRAAGIDIRAGVHTGEIERAGQDVRGVAVHIGARVAAKAGRGELLVSRTVVDLVAGSGIVFTDRGEHELKGVPGSWRIFAVDA